MNIGDGLLFELDNGKPRLILLSHGINKNPAKLSVKPRANHILSSKQISVDDVQVQQVGGAGEARSRGGGGGGGASSRGRCNTLISSKIQEPHTAGGGAKTAAKVKQNRLNTPVSLRTNRKLGQSHNSQANQKGGPQDKPANHGAGLQDSMVCLTQEQLQQILNSVHTSNDSGQTRQVQDSPENKTDSKLDSSVNETKTGGAETGRSQDKDKRPSGGLFSWLDERPSDSRALMDAKKAQWKRELDEQVALKQNQRSAPGRLQAEEDTEPWASMHSSISYRELPAAIRSSLRLGEVTPVEDELNVEKREEQRRRWLEELDRQREERTARHRHQKLLQNQTEDHELWVTHFNSLQRKPVPPTAPSVAPSERGENRDWEPSSSLSLVWEEASGSCGAESVELRGGAQTRTSYLRTMTSLLDPAQIEERERRRLKQKEQQRAIEAQVEERRQQREQEEARRRQEEEEEEWRVVQERETLRRQYELDTLRERQRMNLDVQEEQSHQAAQPITGSNHKTQIDQQEQSWKVDIVSSVCPYKDTAVQTEAAPSVLKDDAVQTPDVYAEHRSPPPPPGPPPPPHGRSRVGKENICVPGGGDPYEAFARTDRSTRDKRRPEWNTQRPSRRFVPASQRYPIHLQRNRQESRLRRQAELLALQERTCVPRTELPPPQHQEQNHLLCDSQQTRTSPTTKVDGGGGRLADRGCSPHVPAVRHQVQSPENCSPPTDLIPYLRTNEDPLEPADTPPPQTHTAPLPQTSASPAVSSSFHHDSSLHQQLLHNTHRQQEILRGLAQLRQGLLQKQRELGTDLNPLLKYLHSDSQSASTAHHM
ncbi:coiled-coil domain-containing protein 66 isoform X2 [Sphaeramia orbicularis]|uniref:coiled-coil domain-containing protein 66 isoform X2 n=1 Tax=Sphaeramia orbicularis TaxID=375764 RepID=UPI0011801711|nr:coiled-coil domain-containing protein 66 isoform X2 [Sphaeramia orbicularis]